MANQEQDSNYELKTEVVTINRTALVKRGGRRFSFTAVVVVGDQKSKIGMGIGKAKEVSLAVQKAVGEAKKNMISIHFNQKTQVNRNFNICVISDYVTSILAKYPNTVLVCGIEY